MDEKVLERLKVETHMLSLQSNHVFLMLKDGSYCFEAYGANKSSRRSPLFSKTERGRELSPAALITAGEAGTQRIEV